MPEVHSSLFGLQASSWHVLVTCFGRLIPLLTFASFRPEASGPSPHDLAYSSDMKRSEKKTGIPRRRSSGTFKFGKLRLGETLVVPGKNANFSLGEGGSTNPNSKPKLLQSPKKRESSATSRSPAAIPAAHAPIPLPSSHVHRTASEVNLLVCQRDAVQREQMMFQRILSGMADRNGGKTVEVSVTTSSSQKNTVEVRGNAASTTLSHAKDASERLLEGVTTETDDKTSPSQTHPVTSTAPQPKDFFVGSYQDFKKITSPRHVTSSLLKLQQELGDNAPGSASRVDRRFSANSDAGNNADDEDEGSDGEVFPIDI